MRLTTFDNQLPQGAPTSTPLANLALVRVDYRLMRLQLLHEFNYTRWVDDLIFSGSVSMLKLLGLFRRIVEDEEFRLGPEKTKIMVRGQRQTVLNFTVNEKVNVRRERRSAIKAEIRRCIRRGLPLSDAALGRMYWLKSVNEKVGGRLLPRARGEQE